MTNTAIQHDEPNTGNQIVTANIRGALGYLGKNQIDLAHALGISEMALSRRMSAHHAAEFSASEILDAAEFLGMPAGDLFKTRGGGGSGLRTFLPVAPRLGLEPRTYRSTISPENTGVIELHPRIGEVVEHKHLAPVTPIGVRGPRMDSNEKRA